MSTEIKNLKKLKSIDIEEFNGVKTTISSVELLDVEEKDFGDGKQLVRQILVKSQNLSKDLDKPITGSEYISLKRDGDDWGFSDSPKSKAMRMLSFFKVSSLDELVGKDVVAIMKQRDNGKTFLGLNFGG